MTRRATCSCGRARVLEEHAHIVLLTGMQAKLPRSVQIDVLPGLSSLKCEKATFDHLTAMMFETDFQYGQNASRLLIHSK